MFKVGDRVICVDDKNFNNEITTGKIYEVYDMFKRWDNYMIIIKNDFGTKVEAYLDRFELVPQEKIEYTKSYLMQEPERWIVKCRDGGMEHVNYIKDSLCWNEDLKYKYDSDGDIVEIYEVSKTPVWKREVEKPTREMTIEEICEELGYPIRIVKGE